MVLRQIRIKSDSIGAETDTVQQRIGYEKEKLSLYDKMKTYFGSKIQGMSFMSDGSIEVIIDDTIGSIQSFVIANDLTPQIPSHPVLEDGVGSVVAAEKLKQDPAKAKGNLTTL